MTALRAEISAFKHRKDRERDDARQLAACHLLGGIDLAQALASGPAERQRLLARLERLIERERLRGMRRHWSYDLNRHIALKQVIDRLREPADEIVVHKAMTGSSMRPRFR